MIDAAPVLAHRGGMDLSDFIAKRRVEIGAQMATLKMELAKLDAAEKAAARVSAGWESLDNLPKDTAARSVKRRGVRPGSIKDWALKALAHQPGGLETEEVILTVGLLGGPEVPRNSMTPQLSRLKEAGLITQVGRHWMLPGDALEVEPEHTIDLGEGDEPEAEMPEWDR